MVDLNKFLGNVFYLSLTPVMQRTDGLDCLVVYQISFFLVILLSSFSLFPSQRYLGNVFCFLLQLEKY